MARGIAFDYHYGAEAEQYAFFRIPKILITDPYFKTISTDAKLLYGLLLDRMSLSIKNRWLDEENRVYIYFSVDEAMEQLNCATEKITRLFAELDTKKGIGLIERVRQGQGKPSRIYVKRFIAGDSGQDDTPSRISKSDNQDFRESKVKTFDKRKSRISETEGQDFRKSKANNTKINNTDFSKTDPSIYPAQPEPRDVIEGYREEIKENIEYNYLRQQCPYDDIDEIVDFMLEVFCTQGDFIKIGTKQLYTELVKERFRRIDSGHIQYIMDNMRETPSDIRNIKAYLLESLFNAPATIGNHFKAKVNYDFRRSG